MPRLRELLNRAPLFDGKLGFQVGALGRGRSLRLNSEKQSYLERRFHTVGQFTRKRVLAGFGKPDVVRAYPDERCSLRDRSGHFERAIPTVPTNAAVCSGA